MSSPRAPGEDLAQDVTAILLLAAGARVEADPAVTARALADIHDVAQELLNRLRAGENTAPRPH